MIAENYPQLKSNENFLRLQDELSGTENRIAVERRKYNEALADLQHHAATVPQQYRCVALGLHPQRRVFQDRSGRRKGAESAILKPTSMTQNFPNYINGEWVSGAKTFENRNPANTGELVGTFAKGRRAGHARRRSAAAAALPAWSSMSGPARGNILFKAADILDGKFDPWPPI